MDTVIRVGRAKAELFRTWKKPGDRALLIALTGGIGAGKSTVARAFEDLGAVVADADQIAREVVAPDTPGLHAIAKRFGAFLIDEDGALDRSRLAQIVFSDPVARADLETITHPLIAQRADEVLASAPPGGLAVYDVPLLAEAGTASGFDVVIVVDAPLEIRLQRLEARGMSRADAQARIRMQATEDQRRALASIWVTNAGSVEECQSLIGTVVTTWLKAS